MHGENDIGFQIRLLSNLIRRDVEKNISVTQPETSCHVHGWAIDYFYQNRDKNVFQKDFEEKFSIRRSTASNMLKLMEKNGYIHRVNVESDARLKKIVLTEKSVTLHEEICKSIENREKRLRNGISEEDLETFFRVINKLKENMEAENKI